MEVWSLLRAWPFEPLTVLIWRKCSARLGLRRLPGIHRRSVVLGAPRWPTGRTPEPEPGSVCQEACQRLCQVCDALDLLTPCSGGLLPTGGRTRLVESAR